VATRSPSIVGGVGVMEGRAGREVGRVEDDSRVASDGMATRWEDKVTFVGPMSGSSVAGLSR
jgi:hypothetical protein